MIRMLIPMLAGITLLAAPKPWTQSKAARWYHQQPWLVGSNYIPANAINQLEMWQEDTFDPRRIDTELGWAQSIGMNTMRVFLHDLLWQQDAQGFQKRLDTFLTLAHKHHIRPLLVLFDSCWDPNPQLGAQHEPKPGVHNSGWVQGPGARVLNDPSQSPRLEDWVKGVVGAFANDKRILGWDVWNEPDNTNDGSYVDPADKVQRVLVLLPLVFEWARSVHPRQPLTSGVWKGDWSSPGTLSPMEKIQLENSDVISFHSYEPADEFERRVKSLGRCRRPILCTEYMARPRGSTFESILPVAKKYKVGAINWGFVQGRTQTYLPWDSWQRPYVEHPPEVWFHDIFYADGKPYRQSEVDFIRGITAKRQR
ncbi:MAG: 1,4-beta-xylanase [Bryobacteraceae bacterium]